MSVRRDRHGQYRRRQTYWVPAKAKNRKSVVPTNCPDSKGDGSVSVSVTEAKPTSYSLRPTLRPSDS